MKRQGISNPEPGFTAWSDRVERYMRRSIVVLAVLLAFSQVVLQYPSMRSLLTRTEQSEGIPFPGIAP